MPYVITRLCRDCVDSACVAVCPEPDCIVEPRPEVKGDLPNQLFINPEVCIDCGACEPECPWSAISVDDEVPRLFADDIAINAIVAARPHDFVEAKFVKKLQPTHEQVDENRRCWEEKSQPSSEAPGAERVAPGGRI